MRKLGFYPRLAVRSLRLNGKFYLPFLQFCLTKLLHCFVDS